MSVDSENVTVGQKCLVMRAVELVEADYGIDEIVGILEEEKKQIPTDRIIGYTGIPEKGWTGSRQHLLHLVMHYRSSRLWE